MEKQEKNREGETGSSCREPYHRKEKVTFLKGGGGPKRRGGRRPICAGYPGGKPLQIRQRQEKTDSEEESFLASGLDK